MLKDLCDTGFKLNCWHMFENVLDELLEEIEFEKAAWNVGKEQMNKDLVQMV